MGIRAVVEIGIKSGKIDHFKKVGREIIRSVEADEPGTWALEWYFNEDESECYVLEHFADSAAILSHLQNVGELIAALQDSCSIDNLSLFGDASDEVLKAYGALDPSVFKHWAGVSRPTAIAGT